MNSMQKFTQKYTIICLFEDVKEGYNFPSSDWPIHTTFVDTFASDLSKPLLIKEFTDITAGLKELKTNGVKDEYFGPNKEIHVVLLEKNTEIVAMHYHLINKLKEHGLKLNDPQYSEDGFLPHSTVQEHGQINIGDEVAVTNLALVDMFPDEDPYHRKILKVVQLG